MMWDRVMVRVQALIQADVLLATIFQGNVRKAGVSDELIPVIEWTLLSDTETELWAPMLVQFDCWTAKAEDTRRAERKLRSLFHQNRSVTLDTFTMFSEYSDAADLATPNRAGYTGRGIRFRFTPLREQYAQPAP